MRILSAWLLQHCQKMPLWPRLFNAFERIMQKSWPCLFAPLRCLHQLQVLVDRSLWLSLCSWYLQLWTKRDSLICLDCFDYCLHLLILAQPSHCALWSSLQTVCLCQGGLSKLQCLPYTLLSLRFHLHFSPAQTAFKSQTWVPLISSPLNLVERLYLASSFSLLAQGFAPQHYPCIQIYIQVHCSFDRSYVLYWELASHSVD